MEEADLDRLQLAFVHHMCTQVVRADGVVAEGEAQFLAGRFPREQMVKAGFLDEDGNLTDAYGTAVERALAVLPAELDDEAKLSLMGTLRQAATADEEGSDQREGNVLIVAARVLGLDPSPYAGG